MLCGGGDPVGEVDVGILYCESYCMRFELVTCCPLFCARVGPVPAAPYLIYSIIRFLKSVSNSRLDIAITEVTNARFIGTE